MSVFVNAYLAGKYANSNVSGRFSYVANLPSEQALSSNPGYILGFFASYRLRDIPSRYRQAYISARRSSRKLIIESGICV